MHNIYSFVTGPLAWAAGAAFILGLLGKAAYMVWLVQKKDPIVKSYLSLKYTLRSWLAWIIPFYAYNWRLRPVFTVVTFAFHICLLAAPIFLMAHGLMFENAFGFRPWSLPDNVADIMTVIVIIACGYFAYRRMTLPEAKYVTDASDYILLTIVGLPFLTGFLAYHQFFSYDFMIVLHVIAGEVMLVAIPFTKLSHMILGPMVRAYLGSEFGAVRHVRDW